MVDRNHPPRAEVCVVYDEVTGDILHTHRLITLVGRHNPDPEAIRQVALGFVRARGYSVDRLHVISVSANVFGGERLPRVDVERRALIFDSPL